MTNFGLKRVFSYKTFKTCQRCVANFSEKHNLSKAVKLSYTVHDFEQTGSWELGSLGNHDNTPLIVLHGLFGAKTNWHSIAKRFAQEGRTVITVDNRNHGDSEHSPEMDYYLMRDDVLMLMDDLRLDQAILVGHSMGGKIAMTLALTQPERLKAVVVVDVAPIVSPVGSTLLTYAERMRQIAPLQDVPLSTARRDAETQLRPVVQMPLIRQFLLTNLVERGGKNLWRLNLDAIIDNYYSIGDFPEFSESFMKPTKFIGGSLSPYIREDIMPEIRKLFPSVDVSHVLGAGHWVHSENPPEFCSILRDFLNTLS